MRQSIPQTTWYFLAHSPSSQTLNQNSANKRNSCSPIATPTTTQPPALKWGLHKSSTYARDSLHRSHTNRQSGRHHLPRRPHPKRSLPRRLRRYPRHSKIAGPLRHLYPAVSYHEHNESARTEEFLERLNSGESIALVTDAGTPLISDPGYRVVKSARDAGIKVVPIPGACAAITHFPLADLEPMHSTSAASSLFRDPRRIS